MRGNAKGVREHNAGAPPDMQIGYDDDTGTKWVLNHLNELKKDTRTIALR